MIFFSLNTFNWTKLSKFVVFCFMKQHYLLRTIQFHLFSVDFKNVEQLLQWTRVSRMEAVFQIYYAVVNIDLNDFRDDR